MQTTLNDELGSQNGTYDGNRKTNNDEQSAMTAATQRRRYLVEAALGRGTSHKSSCSGGGSSISDSSNEHHDSGTKRKRQKGREPKRLPILTATEARILNLQTLSPKPPVRSPTPRQDESSTRLSLVQRSSFREIHPLRCPRSRQTGSAPQLFAGTGAKRVETFAPATHAVLAACLLRPAGAREKLLVRADLAPSYGQSTN